MSSTIYYICKQLAAAARETVTIIEDHDRYDLVKLLNESVLIAEEVAAWTEKNIELVCATTTRYNLQTSGKSLKPVGCSRELVIAQIARGLLTDWEEYCSGQDLRDIYFAGCEIEQPLGRAHSPGINNKTDLINAIHAQLEKVRESDNITVE